MHRTLLNKPVFGVSTKPVEEITNFLPCPSDWLMEQALDNRRLRVSRRCAIEVLSVMDNLPDAAYLKLNELRMELGAIANNE